MSDGRLEASAEITRWLSRSRAALASGGWANTFVARAAAPVPGEVGVVILASDDESHMGTVSVPPRQGVAAVGRIADPEARITIRNDGTARSRTRSRARRAPAAACSRPIVTAQAL